MGSVPPARSLGSSLTEETSAALLELDVPFSSTAAFALGRVLAALIGFLGDFDLAGEAAQEAFAIAAERWPREGAPDNPGAWLVTTARNRAIDRIRRDRTLAHPRPIRQEIDARQ